jgi:pimeloyl-ACP methyl ester carboxylesterase
MIVDKRSPNMGQASAVRLIAAMSALAAFAGFASAQQPIRFAGADCVSPPVMHCPDKDCPPDRVASQGAVVEMKTRRTYFLDYACDLKPGEKVTFVLNLHGGGSNGNWQRHYFPIMDFADKYRLVIATPNSPTRVWSEADDDYLMNIVNSIYEQAATSKLEIKAFWLAGHSQGGQTSNRLLVKDFYRQKLTGWLSLSGGRLGSKRADIRAPIPSAPVLPGATVPTVGRGSGAAAPQGLALSADASVLPDYNFSHIYVTGEHELNATGLPGNSRWAEKLKCGAQTRRADIVDAKAGYVYDSRPQVNPNAVWGFKARPGKAEVFAYPGCENGRVVADIVRIDKGHTEGYEPNLTEEIVKMMVAAR